VAAGSASNPTRRWLFGDQPRTRGQGGSGMLCELFVREEVDFELKIREALRSEFE
jgi:hypothetical protein